MRRLLVTLAALAFVIPASAQDSKGKPIPWANKFFSGKTETPPPVILHDFGTLPQGTVKTYRFNMTNIYAVPMQVIVPNPSCRCISILKYTGQMGPRETGFIDIQIDTSRIEGPKKVEMKVKFEGRDAETKELFWSYADIEIQAVSRADISIKPGAIQFGTVPAGQKAEQATTIVYNGRQREWRITEFGGYNKAIMDVAVAPVAVRGATAYQVTATLKPGAPAGGIDEQIVLKTNDKESPVLMLSVTGTVQAPLTVFGAPGNIVKMGFVEVGKKLEKRVIVQADKKFKVIQVSGTGEGFSAQITPSEELTSQPVVVVFSPDKAGPVKKELTVKTSTGESIVLTVEGVGTEPK
jgi:hypothetical protein